MRADGAFALGGADHGDRVRSEHAVKGGALGHGEHAGMDADSERGILRLLAGTERRLYRQEATQ